MSRQFHINTTPINGPAAVQNLCNAVSFYNSGNTIATVNGVPILPLQGWTPFEPCPGDRDNTNYIIAFQDQGVDDPVNQLWYIRKEYDE